MASQFGVSHFIILSETDIGTNMRIARHPRGPTLHFRVEDYTLTREVVASQMKPKAPSRAEFSNSPLVRLIKSEVWTLSESLISSARSSF